MTHSSTPQLLRPFFSLYGAKWRSVPHYPSPTHSTIVEPFAGSAGYALRHPQRQVILVERDPVIAATWRYLIRVSAAEILALPDIEPGEDVRSLSVTVEAQYLIGWWLQKGSSGPKRTRSSWGRDPRYARQFWGDAAKQRIASQVERIRHWRIIEGGYADAPGLEATWFIDPPYQQAGRHYVYGCRKIDYSDLSAFCRQRRGQVIVCENEGADWLPFEPFRKAKANESRCGGKVSAEAIWTNGDAP